MAKNKIQIEEKFEATQKDIEVAELRKDAVARDVDAIEERRDEVQKEFDKESKLCEAKLESLEDRKVSLDDTILALENSEKTMHDAIKRAGIERTEAESASRIASNDLNKLRTDIRVATNKKAELDGNVGILNATLETTEIQLTSRKTQLGDVVREIKRVQQEHEVRLKQLVAEVEKYDGEKVQLAPELSDIKRDIQEARSELSIANKSVSKTELEVVAVNKEAERIEKNTCKEREKFVIERDEERANNIARTQYLESSEKKHKENRRMLDVARSTVVDVITDIMDGDITEAQRNKLRKVLITINQ